MMLDGSDTDDRSGSFTTTSSAPEASPEEPIRTVSETPKQRRTPQVYTFKTSLTPLQRRKAHYIAEYLELDHVSEGI